jgi:hypothetical protein
LATDLHWRQRPADRLADRRDGTRRGCGRADEGLQQRRGVDCDDDGDALVSGAAQLFA